MIAIDDDQTTIHLTKGDATGSEINRLALQYPIWDFENEEETLYEFQLSDKLTFTIFEKKGYTKVELLKKSYTIASLGYVLPTTTPELVLTDDDTKVFEQLNKRQTYWYDIVLNDTTTILGMDEDGAKKIIVYPEAEEDE